MVRVSWPPSNPPRSGGPSGGLADDAGMVISWLLVGLLVGLLVDHLGARWCRMTRLSRSGVVFVGQNVHNRPVMPAITVRRHPTRISTLDPKVVWDIVRFRQLTSRQIQRIHFADGVSQKSMDNRTSYVLKRVFETGLVNRLPFRRIGAGGPGSTGYVYQGPKVTARKLIDHTYDVAEVYVQLLEAARAGRGTLIDYQPGSYAHRTIAGRELEPDAKITLEVAGVQRNRYLEVDRDSERPNQIREKLDQYIEAARHWPPGEVFPRVVFVVSHEIPGLVEPRRRKIAQQLGEVTAPYRPLFSVTTMDQVVDHLLAGLGWPR